MHQHIRQAKSPTKEIVKRACGVCGTGIFTQRTGSGVKPCSEWKDKHRGIEKRQRRTSEDGGGQSKAKFVQKKYIYIQIV